jgi:uncharacterized damage-inducible protein DinB
MNREFLLQLWNDMAGEGNWVPSWTETLASVSAEEALWKPDPPCHSLWEELMHVIYWRGVTLRRMAGGEPPTEDEVAEREFALPAFTDEENWKATLALFQQNQEALAATITDESQDIERIPYHILHDAYHLGRITQLLAMQGSAPKF